MRIVAMSQDFLHLTVPNEKPTQRPQLYEEQVRPHVFPAWQDQLRLHNPMRCRLSQRPDPPLATCQCG